MKNRFFGKIKKVWEDYEIGHVFINGRAYHGKHPIKDGLKSLLYWLIAVVIIILIINLS